MKKLASWFVLVLSIVLVGGCATTGERNRERVQQIQKVGVVSIAAGDFYRQITGFTRKGDEIEIRDVRNWQLDELYAKETAGVLQELSQFQISVLPSVGHRLHALYPKKMTSEVQTFRRLNWTDIEEPLKAIAAENGVDAIVLITSRESGDFLTGSSQVLRGLGLFHQGLNNAATVSVLHVLGRITLIDGQTGKPLSSVMLSRVQDGLPISVARGTPVVHVEADLIKSRLEELPASKWEEIHRHLVEAPQAAWQPSVRALVNRM